MNALTHFHPTVEQIAFADLTLSGLNPRTQINEGAIADLAENIRAFGLIQNLAGWRPERAKVEIVAGGRRLRALALLQDDPRFQVLDVKIAPDEDTARVWATSENSLREQLHPADEIRDYAHMQSHGATVAQIALAFGATEKHVYRRLALADLPAPVLEALAADEISLSMAAAFTVSDDPALSLEVLGKVRGSGVSERQIKGWLKPSSVTSTDRRATYVGLEAYKAAGGAARADLFAETVYLDDVSLLDRLFAEKLAARAEQVRADEGWLWAETTTETSFGWHGIDQRNFGRIYKEEGVLSEEDAERYEELAELAEADALDDEGRAALEAYETILEGRYSQEQLAVAGVFFYVDWNGNEGRVNGLIRPEDKEGAIAAGLMQASQHGMTDEAPKSPISAKLAEDLAKVVAGARQHAVLRDPDLLIDLLAYQLSHNLAWDKPFGLSLDTVPNMPSTDAEGYALDPRLTTDPLRDMFGKDHAKSFRAFRAKGADHVRGELVRFLAAQYRGGSAALQSLVAKEVCPSIREVWTPTAANFFGRVGGPYLNSLWQDLLGLAEEHPTVTTFQRLKKGEKAAKLEDLFANPTTQSALGLSEEQLARIAAWLPEGMA